MLHLFFDKNYRQSLAWRSLVTQGYMVGVGFKKLARTPVPILSPSPPPSRTKYTQDYHEDFGEINQSKVNLGRLYILL